MPRKFDFLSPGIEINEVDQSILPAEVDADGPVIIGRFRKGPGMKPAKIRSLDNFVTIYGNPVPGGSSLKGDIWRDGPQLSAPTYAAYAAQAWLASRTSPVNLVRLLGDQHPQADVAGYAGWQLSGSGGLQVTNDNTTNSTAYGLFVADLSSLGNQDVPIILKQHTDMNGNISGGTLDANLLLQFFQNTDGSPVTQTVVAGLNLEIVAVETATDSEVGTITDEGQTGTNNCNKISFKYKADLGVNSGTNVLSHIANAIEKALELGYLSGVSVADDGAGNISIFNMGTTELGVFNKTAQNLFKAAGQKGDDNATETALDINDATPNHALTITSPVPTSAASEGCLAAVFYVNSGYMTLDGTDAAGGTVTAGGIAGGLVKSATGTAPALTFKAIIYNAAGTEVENVSFNFDRTSGDYIRNKFNTNPQLVNTAITATSDQKNYWLGESFERSLKEKVTSITAAAQVAALIPLHKDDVNPTTDSGNWGYHRT